MQLRRLAISIGVVLGGMLGSVCASAQGYPTQPVRLIVAFSAGGSVDTFGRIIAQKLGELWGQQVLVENRPGALGNLGAVAAAHAAPDGYTLHLAASSIALNATLAPVADFDPTKNFDPVILAATAQDILIVPTDSRFKTASDLIAYAKANPRKLTYGTLGASSSGNMAMAVFARNNGGLHLRQVTYSQSSQLQTDVFAGRVDVFFPTTGAHIGNVANGRERALGVSGPKRAAQLPDVPTFREQAISYPDATSWYALFAPKGTPAAIVAKINADMERVLAQPEVKALMDKLGFAAIGGPPSRLGSFLDQEIKAWADVVKDPLFRGE